MKVLVLATDVWGRSGGIAQYNRDILEALSDDDRIEGIDVISLNVCAEPQHPKVTVVHAGGNRWRFASLCISRCMDRDPRTVLCAHINFVSLARVMKWLTGWRMWLQIHGIDAWTRPARARADACRHFDFVTAVSRYTRHRFLSWADVPPEIVRVVPNTVQARFRAAGRDAGFRKRLGLVSTDARILLTVSRLSHHDQYKGVDKVISVMRSVLARIPEAVYCIAGDGDDIERLRFEAERQGVAEAVRFLGRIDDDDLPQLYREADLFVMPSTKEGFGIVFIEAMASGTPAMGLGVDGSVDALLEGELGIVSTKEGLADDICAALLARRDPDKLARATQARFGKPVFRENIRRTVSLLLSEPVTHVRR